MYKYKVGKMIQQVKVPDVKPDNLSSMPGTYNSYKISSDLQTNALAMCPSTSKINKEYTNTTLVLIP